MNQCEICMEMGQDDCGNCYLGNPCIECDDYDEVKHTCKSNGACWNKEAEWNDYTAQYDRRLSEEGKP